MLYNKHMGGVDKFDQLCGSYNFNRRSKKWYQILWHFVIEVALVNGRICYNAANSGAAVSQTAFRERVIDGLLQGYERKRSSKVGRPFTTPLEARLTERHFAGQFADKSHKPNCIVCTVLPSACTKKGKRTM